MFDFLYFLFVFPLEQLLTLTLRALFALIQNEALSIILLSLLVNLFLYKIFIWADQKTKIENARKKKFNARIARWKSVYANPKVFAFTQTLYRQNHYHPIYALSALGGLAIQIPFFLAVYFLIQNGNALPNVNFESISTIDSALGIHILPIFMTAITLANVFLSSLEKSARIQGTIIAILFLVLLYEMPHALVLYWTTNMAFSLARAIFKTKITTTKTETKQIQKAIFDFSRHLKIAQKIIAALILISSALFLFALTQGHDSPNYETITQWVSNYFILLGGIVFLYFLFLTKQKINTQNFEDFKPITILSVLNIFFLICVFSPFALYQSDITQFHPSFTTATLFGLLGIFLLLSFLIIYLFHFISTQWQWGIAFLCSVILAVGILNIFWLVGIYGVMDRFVFQTPVYSTPELNLWQNVSNAVALFLSAGFVYFLFLKLKTILKIVFLTLLIVSATHLFHIFNTRFEEDYAWQQQNPNNLDSAPYENELFSYSKNNKNIVVIVLDMFTGSHFPRLLEFFPQFKTQLDGFVWFDNALTSANATPYTLPSIVGGEYYTIINQNKRRDNHDQITRQAYTNTGNAFAQAGYKVGFLSGIQIAERQKIAQEPNFFWLDDMRILQNYFLKQHAQTAFKNTHIFDIAHFLSFGLFKFAPDGAPRHAIYNDGKWFFKEKPIDNSRVVHNISSLYALTQIANTRAEKPTFKFIHSLITHFPYGIYAGGGQCHYLEKGSIFPDPPWNSTFVLLAGTSNNLNAQHFDTEACALFLLNNFFEWLKKENIYDNTQIFVLSDHPGSDSLPNLPRLPSRAFGQDVLFLFKDFNKKGELQTDSRLMANYDAATIFCENLPQGCPKVAPNILKNYPPNRTVLHARPGDSFTHPETLWNIFSVFKIQGNIYDPKSYTDVSAEYATAGAFAKRQKP